MKDLISDNEKTWDIVADQFIEASALPIWGPFGVGEDLSLISDIEGKTFLEIGCGSGRSIKYLIDNGASKVYGVDLSSVQLKEAAAFNSKAITLSKVELIKSEMETQLNIESVDVVFGIYSIGWTIDPEVTLRNIYAYLKPGGKFIWSWDHTFFTDVQYEDDKYFIAHSYHDEKPLALEGWKKAGTMAHLTYRKTSTWFQLLGNAGFDVVGYYEPKPTTLDRGYEEPEKYYSIQKAKLIPATFIFECKKGIGE